MTLRAPLGATVQAAALALVFVAALSAARAADKVVLQLHRPAQFEFAGYYAALWNGYYRKAGIEAAIRPGAGPGATPIEAWREVAEGRAQFGTGTARLLIRDAQGQPLLLLAPIFQSSGARVYYRADTDFSSPGALLNGRIGRLPISSILDIELRSALVAEGIDPHTLRSVPIAPGEQATELAEHRVDAVIGSAWTVPWQARRLGLQLKSFDPADYRVAFYGDSLFTLQPYAREHPGLVQRFRAASLEGWEYALLHPNAIAARMAAKLSAALTGTDRRAFIRYQSAVARRLALDRGIPFGHSNPARWRRIRTSMKSADALAQPVDLTAFLYEPQRAAEGGSPIWPTLVGIAAAALALLGGGLAWRRYHQPSPERSLGSAGIGVNRALAETVRSITDELATVADRIAEALEEIRRQAAVEPRLGRFCGTALEALDNLRAIIRRVAMLPGAPTAEPTDLNVTMTAIERSLRQELPAAATLRLSLLPEAWLCSADPDAVAGAVLDLAAIAAQEMANDGELVIGTRNVTLDKAEAAEIPDAHPGDYLRLTVRDSGPGVPPESLGRILNPRLTTRPAIAAAGQLARALGGFVRVETAAGVGTAVHLHFSRSAPAATRVAAVPVGSTQPSAKPTVDERAAE